MDEIKKNIIKKLRKYKIDEYENLKPLTQKMLVEIEVFIDKSFKERLNAINILKNQKVNIKRITDNTTVSKGTIYNNPSTLKKYIDDSIKDYEELEKKYYDADKTENLLQSNQELMEIIDNLTVELIDMNNLRLENDKLLSENKFLREENEYLIDEREELSREIQSYKKQVRDLIKNGNNLVSINK